ncbi:ricin-type beta-trefoil lectin domain protein [Actinokineospora auranticolor]|uniref:Ricin-type beta-trefoil lectin protein n=1 Tax=Actinokineospora auranticolor TaxID=155976 RepID=A0A2S6GCK9_9PSEU|nr:ricin-type beta-trefoil lectin domain protein [Actinokineospora auranticolor]PPK62583.1 ricin-type beta-trefoil lectin protein [Actinokineospora auranticolor]
MPLPLSAPLLAMAAVAGAVPAAATVPVGPVPGIVAIRSAAGDGCLTSPARLGPVAVADCRADGRRQQWRASRPTDGEVWFAAQGPDWCLGHDAADAVLVDCDVADRAQAWNVVELGDAAYLVQAAEAPYARAGEWCLWHVPGYVGLQPCDADVASQRWELPGTDDER